MSAYLVGSCIAEKIQGTLRQKKTQNSKNTVYSLRLCLEERTVNVGSVGCSL